MEHWASLSVETKMFIIKCIPVYLVVTAGWVWCGEMVDRIDKAVRLKQLEEEEEYG